MSSTEMNCPICSQPWPPFPEPLGPSSATFLCYWCRREQTARRRERIRRFMVQADERVQAGAARQAALSPEEREAEARANMELWQ